MTTKLHPKPIRKDKVMSEQLQMKTKHPSPIVVDSHLPDVTVIAQAAYLQDIRNRMYINNVEVKKLVDQHVEIFNTVKPYVVDAYSNIRNKINELRNNKS